jgi:hypothetical protein
MASVEKPRFGNWQKYLDKLVKELDKNDLIREFNSLRNNCERIKFVHKVTNTQ